MCMFAGSVSHVAATRIFASSDGGVGRFTAYQMEVELKNGQGNAMILPVPTSNPIELVDMSGVPNFFEKMDNLFPRERSRGVNMFKSAPLSKSLLTVHKVGSYEVSVAPTVDDISRVDPSVFELSPSTAAVLAQHYATGYSFVVCKLTKGGEIHPLGYIYETHSMDEIFVPTRHAHGGRPESRAHWDHMVYVQGGKTCVAQPGQHSRGQVSQLAQTSKLDLQDMTYQIQAVPVLATWCQLDKPIVKYNWNGNLENLDVRLSQ